MWLSRIRCYLSVIPGEPAVWIFEQFRRMFLKRRQIMEGVDAVEGTGMNEAHEQIPDVSPMLGPKKQRILPMKDGPL